MVDRTIVVRPFGRHAFKYEVVEVPTDDLGKTVAYGCAGSEEGAHRAAMWKLEALLHQDAFVELLKSRKTA